jgi:hypothetical protein
MYSVEEHLQMLLKRMEGKVEADGAIIEKPIEDKEKKTHKYNDYTASASPIPLYVLGV